MKSLFTLVALLTLWLGISSANAASAGPAPAGRLGNTVIWTGTDMILWGGYFYNGNNTYFKDGWRYNPASNIWTQISTNGAPSARTYHTAVWTGTEMIIWGGQSNSVLNTGARYNPVTDTWIPVSTTNAPSARDNHTAVWTGGQMIVWGGTTASGNPVNDGARYNPVTDTWIPTSSTNAASARTGHTAIWTGTQMIVWGGGFNNNTGGCYNPASDTWKAVNITNAPSPRAYDTAVWTGSEMIIWGGEMTGPPYDFYDGARYNPVSDSWIATITSAAPEARRNHSAVWTGSNMIVWGGNYAYTGDLNDGSRYITNGNSFTTWNPITTTGAPSARNGHSAVWTGTQMIVWGGGSYLNNGGLYNPVSNSWTALGFGGVQTTINPPQAVSLGAQWRVDGANWQNSGITYSNLMVGNHAVSFASVPGWITPSNQTVTIGPSQTTNITATYVQLQPPAFQTSTLTNQTFTLAWTAQAGQNYQVQYTTDLTSTNWINLGSPTNAGSGVMTATDSTTNDTQRFYRVVLEP